MSPCWWVLVLCFAVTVVAFDVEHARREWREKTPYATWKSAGLDSREIAKLIVANMTLLQKIRQLDQYKGQEFVTNGQLAQDESALLLRNTIGQIHDLYPPNSDIPNQLQSSVLELYVNEGVPPIPIKFSEECLHGLNQGGHTVFPQSISLASTWDVDMLQRVGQAIGSETRSYNIRECFSPVLGIAREPRWGRTEETYGEDSHLVAHLGHAMVVGLQQGANVTGASTVTGVGSLIKHFITYSNPLGGRNTAPTRIGPREFLSDFAPSFYRSLSNYTCTAGTEFCLTQAIGTMGAYSERDGVPNCSDKTLLTDLLRDNWGFDGYVLGDLGAVKMLWSTHHTAGTPADSIRQFLNAGGNMQFYDYNHLFYENAIRSMVSNGTLSVDVIDERVQEVIYVKDKLGLLDDPFVDPTWVETYVNSPENRQLALEAAREAIILLKNQNSTLPLPQGTGLNVALIGPNSDASLTGDYSGNPDNNGTTICNYVTVKEGLMQYYPSSIASIRHAWGTGITTDQDMLIIRPSYLFATPPGTQTLTCTQQGLTGEYFNNNDLSGEPVLTRLDNQVNFNWYKYSPDTPANTVREIEFAVRWTGYLVPDIPAEIGSVNGVIGVSNGGDFLRLYLNNELLIDHWSHNSTEGYTAPYVFGSGQVYSIVVEYVKSSSNYIQLEWSLYGTSGISDAVKIAQVSDVVIAVVGEDENTSGENHDRVSLDFPGYQEQLIQAVYETGVPVIVVMLNGRPLSTNWTSTFVPAILECFFTGQTEGQAIAEVLFGDYNPAGRLPITVPYSAGQLPMYYNYKPTGEPSTYVDSPSYPLYYFGYGLSYTTFSYSELEISPQTISVTGSYQVSFTVTNTGSRVGDEVPQIYVTDDVSSVTTAVIQLRWFTRLHDLQPGETRPISVTLEASETLWLINPAYQKVVEPGNFTIRVGPSSHDVRLKSWLYAQ